MFIFHPCFLCLTFSSFFVSLATFQFALCCFLCSALCLSLPLYLQFQAAAAQTLSAVHTPYIKLQVCILPPHLSLLFPSIWLLVSWYAGLDPHCAFLPVSTLFFHLTLSLFLISAPIVSIPSIQKKTKKHITPHIMQTTGRINGLQQKSGNVGYWTRECFHLKEVLRKM